MRYAAMAPNLKAHTCNVGPTRYHTLSLVILFATTWTTVSHNARDNDNVRSSAEIFRFVTRKNTGV